MSVNGKQPRYDSNKAEAFSGKLLNTLNQGALCLMASIGHRTGLFDVMKGQPPLTAAAIATKARLNDRYVREWLGALATAGIIEIDPTRRRFRLPNEHAAFLTRQAGANNIGVYTQYIAVMGTVEDDIVDCFRNGGGVPYERFSRFIEVMAEDSGVSVLAALESDILPLVRDLKDQLSRGLRVLDAGCGSGRILNRLAELYPRSRFTGIDFSLEAIRTAQRDAAEKRLRNIKFIVRDLSDFNITSKPASFDFITTFDAIHDQAKPLNVLKGIYRALKPRGLYLMQDIRGSSHVHRNMAHPIGTFLYTVSTMHCMTVSLAQGGEGLGAMWGEEKTREYLRKAGFRSIVTRQLPHDVQNNWYVVRK